MTDRNSAVDYGNWVSRKLIYVPASLAAVSIVLSFLWRPLLIGTILFVPAVYFVYAHRQFSPQGGDLQARIRDHVLAGLTWNGQGRLLDIGCGNGALAIEAARRYHEAQITAIDPWGGQWEYSRKRCEDNARIASVADRTSFRKASAASLPFPDESFDVVVSNMVFHEVREVKDKRAAIKEALRVLKTDGLFVFQDLFLWKAVYGEPQDLVETIKGWGTREVEFIDTSRQPYIPGALRLPFMVGNIGLLYGKK